MRILHVMLCIVCLSGCGALQPAGGRDDNDKPTEPVPAGDNVKLAEQTGQAIMSAMAQTLDDCAAEVESGQISKVRQLHKRIAQLQTGDPKNKTDGRNDQAWFNLLSLLGKTDPPDAQQLRDFAKGLRRVK